MALLNQVIAIEKSVKSTATKVISNLYKDLQRPEPMSGISRTYSPKDDDGDKLPSESTKVQIKVNDILDEVSSGLTRLFDVVLTKETANTNAKADVVVDGKAILKDIPVTYLLFLEKQLTDISTFVSKIPSLDPAQQWTYDANIGAYATTPTMTTRSKKIPRNHVKAAATDKHPAQVDVFYEDVLVGYWSTVKYSGALPADRIAVLASRVEKLSNAVKYAREQANSIQIDDRLAGAAVFEYLFKE